jgi:adenine-specific DNA-methyltransferase
MMAEANEVPNEVPNAANEVPNDFPNGFPGGLNDAFVYQTMLTCIGNKRKLVGRIYSIIAQIRASLGRPLAIVDGFAGSTVVSRALLPLCRVLYANDLEHYSYLMARCFLVTPSLEQQGVIQGHIRTMNHIAEHGPFVEGVICAQYAPRVTAAVQNGERCFYTRENALIIDTLCAYLRGLGELRPYCLAPLLTRASIHTNTAGVFKGFYKKDGVGHFGGAGENALGRIMAPIRLDVPLWADGKEVHCTQMDVHELIAGLPEVDVMYLDPPYNQHPYGSNYFMLNVIAQASNAVPNGVQNGVPNGVPAVINEVPNEVPATNEVPAHAAHAEQLSAVSGIPVGWNKSRYNSREAVVAMRELIEAGLRKARYLLISYNNEGIITAEQWEELLRGYQVSVHEVPYDTYRGSRNLKERALKVVERMYLVWTF